MSYSISAKLQKDITEIRVVFAHISEDGQRQDPKTGKFIPADFIQKLLIKADDRVLVESSLGGGLAHNPYFLFKARGLKAGTKVSAEWSRSFEVTDAKGKKEVKEDKGTTETRVISA